MLGSGKGSWEMRGLQLGAAIGARVTSLLSPADLAWADVIVLVKRALVSLGQQVAKSGKPIVWDALDFWQQPVQNTLKEAAAITLAQAHMRTVSPALVIGATDAMARALGGEYLPHHSWDGLVPTPPRARMKIVGYQGNPLYLGRRRQQIEQICAARGWTFVINPDDLSTMDVLVALREGPWDGWICRQWKSGVKVVNAIAAGRPLISQQTAATAELRPHGLRLETETAEELAEALDVAGRLDMRQDAYEASKDYAPEFTLDAIADRYRGLLARIGAPCLM